MHQQNMCIVCKSKELTDLLNIVDIPVQCNRQWSKREEAIQAPKGDIHLTFCRNCGHIFNTAYNPDLMAYTHNYENSLHFSPRFQDYAANLAARLVNDYELYNKDIIEIGCGQGDFLRMMCHLGNNRGTGFDPSFVPKPENPSLDNNITIIQDYFSDRYSAHHADLIYSRHVLEHIQFPQSFITDLRRSIETRLDTIIFFEVPNVLYTIKDLGIWDIIYEHTSYFSPDSLLYLFRANGFKILKQTTEFEGQFLCVDAVPHEDHSLPTEDPSLVTTELISLVADFSTKYREKLTYWRSYLRKLREGGQRVVVWGGGSKGVTFLNALQNKSQIEYVVDINPRKQGKYVAGTGQKIIRPSFLQDYQPDIVLVMNHNYFHEIQQSLAELDVRAQLLQL